MPATTLCLNNILNYNFGSSAYSETLPATMWIGLSTVVLTPASTGATVTEPTAMGYARVSFTNNKTNWTTSTTASLENDVAIVFPESSGIWGEIVSIFIADVTTVGAGNVWWYYNLNPTITVGDNTTVTFPIASMLVSMT